MTNFQRIYYQKLSCHCGRCVHMVGTPVKLQYVHGKWMLNRFRLLDTK